ncbi:nuclear transport factor 2 family protein [Mucilaginibacter sp. PAMB04168]|uniref:nuclear transport factor 2 family protein n=1 Tax=Mucilaginibacter sp. PAMB04168 TaxID=3138567 RepID=UPI0031F70E3E
MTQQQANEFARQWIGAWNSHNIDQIMEHYADDVEFYSPMIIQLGFDSNGKINGKSLLQQYFQIGLTAYPSLSFQLHHVLCGINSLVIHYQSVNKKLASELMQLNEQSKAACVMCHY